MGNDTLAPQFTAEQVEAIMAPIRAAADVMAKTLVEMGKTLEPIAKAVTEASEQVARNQREAVLRQTMGTRRV